MLLSNNIVPTTSLRLLYERKTFNYSSFSPTLADPEFKFGVGMSRIVSGKRKSAPFNKKQLLIKNNRHTLQILQAVIYKSATKKPIQ